MVRLITLFGLYLWLGTATAFAHASLISTDPPEGSILQQSPTQLVLTFNEAVRPLVARLSAPGTTHLLDPPQVRGLSLIYPLPADLGRGSHLLSWRVTSADGHPLAGASLFSIGAETGLSAPETAAPLTSRVLLWGARAGLIMAVLVGVGGALFRAVLPDHRRGDGADTALRRVVIIGLGLIVPVGGLQGLDLLGLPPGGLLSAAPWQQAIIGPPALALLLTAGALMAALRPGGWHAVAALILAAAGAATSGHAATAPPQWLMRPATGAHVAAAIMWIGALIPLGVSLAAGRQTPLARFSQNIPWVIGVLLASGGAIAVVQLGTVQALWTTVYGQVLAVKLGLVAALLLVALANRIWLTRRAERGDTAPLRRAIAVEIGLAVLVVAVLSLWRFTPPPRTIPPPLPDLVQRFTAGPISATLIITPPREGPIQVRMTDLQDNGAPIAAQSVQIEFTKPAYGLGPFRREVTGSQDLGTFVLPLDGFWVVTLRVQLSDFHAQDLRDLIEIAPAR
ncbi:MAG TPA: CopD family protein [Paenirhodobacter sp.]